jgi:hypothetical protein
MAFGSSEIGGFGALPFLNDWKRVSFASLKDYNR